MSGAEGGVASPVPAPSSISKRFGFLPTRGRAYSSKKGASFRSFFPSVNKPNYVEPERLAAVPEHTTERLEFCPELLVNPLDQWEEAAVIESTPPTTWTTPSSDPFLFPRLTKNERCVIHSYLSFIASYDGIKQRSPDNSMVLYP
jgi:hypothetical protein